MPGRALVVWDDRAAKRAMRNHLRRGVRGAGREVRDEARRLVSTKGGRSSPGTPPHRRSGRLLKTIRHAVRESRSQGTITARIGSSSFVARILHTGTRFMKPRPWWEQAYRQAKLRAFRAIVRGGRGL